jgi:predicted metal-dependent phosphoesterase TrpH
MNSSFTKLDMHVHSEYSKDSELKLLTISKFLEKNKDYGIVLSDHNEIDGALELAKSYPDRVIVGEEIRTNEGEVTGLFLKEKIPAYQKIDWTLDAILSQGGLIYIPHPNDRLRTSRLTEQGLNKAIAKADIIEVFNSRNVFSSDDRKAFELAKENEIILGCGSDAHTRWELGNSYMLFNESFELTPMSFLDALENAKQICRRSFLGVHFITKAKKIVLKYKKD